MRARIADARGTAAEWDLKAGPGGVQDIELLSQAGALIAGNPARATLAQIEAGRAVGWLTDAEAADLAADFALQQRVRTALRLLGDAPADPVSLGQGALAMIRREAGGDPASMLAEARRRAADHVATVLSRPFRSG
jgi:glutamate-ammonia-ligase adenylyltransferase